jgi:tyrosyl-tRNA synthetase
MSFIEELTWRGMIHDIMPGTEEQLNKELTRGYVGFDPTADSLHIGNLVPITLLVHLQKAGHQPIALVGGATGMVGDPSGKSEERNLLTRDVIEHNLACQKKQLEKFLDFNSETNPAIMVNNYDWFKDFGFLEFIRDVGKHISVNYMMAKDSVKNRLENGMSFTEFSYQLVQGYDFYHLFKNMNCKIQMGGSDQWGNITTGTELIRRMGAGEAFAVTTPLIKKADGGKFGKSEKGNVWLDAEKTSPYEFYQFWINAADSDAVVYIKTFSLKDRAEIEALIAEHENAPHLRIVQKAIAEELTERVHSKKDLEAAIDASSILFGNATSDKLKAMSERDFLAVFDGVPRAEISKSELEFGIGVLDLLASKTGFLASNGEARRALKENSISINKEKINSEEAYFNSDALINGKYLLLQRGKKKYFIVSVS